MEKNKINGVGNSDLVISQEKLLGFFGTAVHDIKAPFRNISSYLDLIKSKINDCSTASDFEPYFQRIDTARNKVTALLEELMKFIRTSAADMKQEDIDITALLKELTQEIEGAEITVAENCATVKADPAMLRDLFRSLISNAVKFKGEKPLQLRISVTREKNIVKINVNDNGMGIDEKYFEKIFEPFERLNSPDEFPGAGLGLSICKMIIEKHGGQILVNSEIGKGSTFSIMLPS